MAAENGAASSWPWELSRELHPQDRQTEKVALKACNSWSWSGCCMDFLANSKT